MNAITPAERLALDGHDGEDCNTSGNPSLNDILDARLSRRNVLRMSVGSAGAAVLGSVALTACGGGGGDEGTPATPMSLSFTPVAKSLADSVTVAAGYTATPIYALGDPLTADTADFKNDGTDTG